MKVIKIYFPNGILNDEITLDENNVRHGLSSRFDDKGIIQQEFLYVNGMSIEEKIYEKSILKLYFLKNAKGQITKTSTYSKFGIEREQIYFNDKNYLFKTNGYDDNGNIEYYNHVFYQNHIIEGEVISLRNDSNIHFVFSAPGIRFREND